MRRKTRYGKRTKKFSHTEEIDDRFFWKRRKRRKQFMRKSNVECDFGSISEFLEKRGVTRSAWDLALIGDGAGSEWKNPCGSAVIAVDRHSETRKLLYAGFSELSVGNAEIWPYVHALAWYSKKHGLRSKHRGLVGSRALNVHIITDNSATAENGENLATGRMSLNQLHTYRELWAGLIYGATLNQIALHFHWIPRMTVGLNAMADGVADLGKRGIITLDMIAHYQASEFPSAEAQVETTTGVCALEDLIYSINAAPSP